MLINIIYKYSGNQFFHWVQQKRRKEMLIENAMHKFDVESLNHLSMLLIS